MNNNRNNNNRRGRGRNNNNNRGQGGGNSANRIDSRARGNAPQMLDKYKKLAQDANHHDDRVQAEYYLQFADHYFRVIADNKALQDEARAKRQDGRNDGRGDGADDDNDNRSNNRRNNNRRPQGRDDDNSDDRSNANGRDTSNRGRGRKPRADGDYDKSDVVEHDDGDDKPAKPARKPRATTARKPRAKKDDSGDGEIDMAALPPAIGDSEEEAPKPKRAPRKKKVTSEDSDGALEAAG